MEISDFEDIEEMETTTEGVGEDLAASSTGPDEIEAVNEGSKKEECDAINIGELIQDCDKSDANWEVLNGIWNAAVMICTELSKMLRDGVRKLTKCVQSCVQSDSESEGPNELMVRLIKVVTELSQKLTDFMVSLSRKEDKFPQFISRLRSFDEYKKSLVIRKVVHVLQMVEDNLEELKIESLRSMGEELYSIFTQIEDLEDKSPTDDILNRFFDIILHLEGIISHPGLHKSEELTGGELSQLEDGLKQCEEDLEVISLKVNDMKVTYSYFLRLENNELWKTTLSIIEDMCNDMEFEEESQDSESS